MQQRILVIQLKEILSTMGTLPHGAYLMSKPMLQRKKRDVLTKHKNHPNADNAIMLIEKLLLLEG